MRANWVQLVAMACAGFAVVATVVGWVMKAREIKALREIRDRLDEPRR